MVIPAEIWALSWEVPPNVPVFARSLQLKTTFTVCLNFSKRQGIRDLQTLPLKNALVLDETISAVRLRGLHLKRGTKPYPYQGLFSLKSSLTPSASPNPSPDPSSYSPSLGVDSVPFPPLQSNDRPSLAFPPIYFTLDAAGTILAVNPNGASSLGYSARELIGQAIGRLFHPQGQEQLQSNLQAIALHPEAVKQGESYLMGQDGSITLHAVTLQALQTLSPEPNLLLVCHRLLPMAASPSASADPEEQQALQTLHQQTHQQTEWENLLRVLAQPLRQSADLRSLLHILANKVRQSLQVDRLLIYQSSNTQINAEPGHLLAESLAAGCPSVLTHAQAISTLQHRFSQLQSSPVLTLLSEQHAAPLGAVSEVVIPIYLEGHLWGMLIAHQCRQVRPWQGWELGLLQQLTPYLDSLIQQTEFYHHVQRLNADLERQIQARTAELQLASEFEATLKRITDKVRDSLDERQILGTVVEELVCTIGISGCNASMYNLEAGTSSICYEYTTGLLPYQGRVLQLDAFPEVYEQLLNGQSFQFCSLMINPMRGKVSMLTCPIVDDQGVLGDLWLVNQSYYCFSEQDIRLVQQVANQCAIAIRQARLYQAAQAQVKELERLNRLKDDFLSTVSHELRTPMANIKMATQMLEVMLRQSSLLGKDHPKVARYFQILQAECQREISLINDLLDLSRLDVENMELRQEVIDLPNWLSKITHPFVERANQHHQQLQLALPDSPPPLLTDASSLERILAELLQNACKYTPLGGKITVAAIPTATTLQLSVTNSGVEIPLQELSRVFEKFYRIPNNDPWQHGGTGLGLALVKKLAEHLGGTLWAESGAGETRFILELPLQPPPTHLG